MSGQQFEFMETIRANAAKDIAESEKRFGSETLQLAKNHEERVANAEHDEANKFLVGLRGEVVTPETFALAHVYMSGGMDDKKLPEQSQLDPIVEAAEKAIEIVESADMVAVVGTLHSLIADIELSEIGPDSERKIRFGSASRGVLYLPETVGCDVFNLVGKDNLDLPINDPANTSRPIKQIKDEVKGKKRGDYEEIPLIVGRDAISEFVTRIGLDIPVTSQIVQADIYDSLVDNGLFGSMALQVADTDKDMARDIVAEVRDGKPSLITKIQKEYTRILDIQVRSLGNKDEDDAHNRIEELKELMPDAGGAEIFFTEEELVGVRLGLYQALERSIEKASKSRKDSIAESLSELL